MPRPTAATPATPFSFPRRLTRLTGFSAAGTIVALLAACAGVTTGDDPPVAQRIERLLPADVVILGERHDAADHHRIEREAVEALAARGRLAALALEMAEEGRSTVRLPATASEAQVQAALAWDDRSWGWPDYGPAIMAAVRAGVPVLGANLPIARIKDAMADVSLDAQLGDRAREEQRDAVRTGHCDLLPEGQIVPMTRVQIARDRAMAQTLVKARQPGRTVLLITGSGHAIKTLGVPQHLPTDITLRSVRLQAGMSASAMGYDAVWLTPVMPARDYCAGLRAK